MDNNKTLIVETPIYMDIDDPKNNWYLDAEKFDVNFPLAYTYRNTIYPGIEKIEVIHDGKVDEQKRLAEKDVLCEQALLNIFKCQYNFLSSTAEYFSFSERYSALIVERKNSYKLDYCYDKEYIDPNKCPRFSDSVVYSNITNATFSFSIVEKQSDIWYRREVIIAPIPSLSELKSRYFVGSYSHPDAEDLKNWIPPGFDGPNVFSSIIPYDQLIVTKDWDLVKRYLFFMIRNHRYDGAVMGFSSEKEDYVNNKKPLLFRSLFCAMDGSITDWLPCDYRSGTNIKCSRDCNIKLIKFNKFKGWSKAVELFGDKFPDDEDYL